VTVPGNTTTAAPADDDIKCPEPSVLLEPLKEFIEKAQKNGTIVPMLVS
jgi:hypothetical protein